MHNSMKNTKGITTSDMKGQEKTKVNDVSLKLILNLNEWSVGNCPKQVYEDINPADKCVEGWRQY